MTPTLYTKMKRATRKDKVMAVRNEMPVRGDADAYVVLYMGKPTAWSYNGVRARVAAELAQGKDDGAIHWTDTGKLMTRRGNDGPARFTGYEVVTVGQLMGER